MSDDKSAVPSSATTKPQTSYVPLTEEEIEEFRLYFTTMTLNKHLTEATRKRAEILCSMAVNCLLYAQEIDRLRSAPSPSETINAEPQHSNPTAQPAECPGRTRGTRAEPMHAAGSAPSSKATTQGLDTEATLWLEIEADSGYESREDHRITPEQWEKIQRVIHGTEQSAPSAMAPTLSVGVWPMLVQGQLAIDDKGIILMIDSEQSESEQAITLWHEVLHLLGLTDEEKVEALAHRLKFAVPEIMSLVRRRDGGADAK